MCVCVVEKWNKGDATTGCYTIYGIVPREQEEQYKILFFASFVS